jgi:hypothetical protein
MEKQGNHFPAIKHALNEKSSALAENPSSL